MNAGNFRFIESSNLNAYRDAVIQLARNSWPEFMWHDEIVEEHWHELFDSFPEYQAVLLDADNDRIAAIGHSLPFRWAGNFADLPENGWDWVIAEGVKNQKNGVKPNIQAAIMVAIAPDYQRHGLSANLLNALSSIGKSKGFENLVVPVRPNLKSQYPLISMDDYINWTDEEGLPFDAWLRVHLREGGVIVKVCHAAKTIRGNHVEWEEWTGLKFPQSGYYIIAGALNPMEISIEMDEGVYTEPNVWIHHSLA
jgi:GNAT superfamily N-acetyltransferase